MSNDPATTYREEAAELLEIIEQSLLELESDPGDEEGIAKVFRAMHTIKGSGSMFGFDQLARFTHEVETVFDRVRAGTIPLDKDLLTLTLTAKDHIQTLLNDTKVTKEDVALSNELITKFRAYLRPVDTAAAAEPTGTGAPATGKPFAPSAARTWLVRYRPAANTFMSGTDPFGLMAELEELGRAWSVFRPGSIPSLEALDPEIAYGWWDILLITDKGLDAIKDVFIFVEDDNGVDIAEIHSEPVRESDIPLLVRMVAETDGKSHLDILNTLRLWIASKISLRAPKAESAEARPVDGKEAQAAISSIRVDSARLDVLVNLVGELVIVQSRLSQAAQGSDNATLKSIAEELQRLSAEMRDQALGIRMIPIGSIYSTMRRLVRDLCESIGKSAAFTGLGAQTELDKNVIDQLKDPLVHILRNSIDHGIETPEARLACGKAEKGNIVLDAVHSGGNIVITITDDGAGINAERVRAKAMEKGLIAPGDELGDKEIVNLIFAPGFSTAQTVTSVSGRGVGMDVVKRNIENLRGTVEIESVQGKGTTMTIRLPLTLAIIDGLHVRVGPELYVLPLSAIEACQERFIRQPPPAVGSMEYRGGLIPCVSIRRLLEVPGPQPDYERIIVAGVDNKWVGLAVDAVLGQQQAVIKPLADVFSGLRFIAGTTVTGDGGVSVILDVPNLVSYAFEKQRMAEAAAGAALH